MQFFLDARKLANVHVNIIKLYAFIERVSVISVWRSSTWPFTTTW